MILPTEDTHTMVGFDNINVICFLKICHYNILLCIRSYKLYSHLTVVGSSASVEFPDLPSGLTIVKANV